MSDLSGNIEKLHTTPMGAERIKRNLGLQESDVVAWCKQAVLTADTVVRKGKNWYAYKNCIVITVNSGSLTLITAHKTKANSML